MRQGSSIRLLLLPLFDAAILCAAFVGAVYLRFNQDFGEVLRYPNLVPRLVVSVFVLQLCLYYADLYEDLPLQRPFDTAIRFVQSFLAGRQGLLRSRTYQAGHMAIFIWFWTSAAQ